MHSTIHSRRAASLCSSDDGVQRHQISPKQQDIHWGFDRNTSRSRFICVPPTSQPTTMGDPSDATTTVFGAHTAHATQLSCQPPVGQWCEEAVKDVDPNNLFLGLHECLLHNNTHHKQDFSFPQAYELGMDDYTMAFDPSMTLQHYVSSPSIEYLPPSRLDCSHTGGLDFCSMPLDAATTMYPFSGYPESNFLTDFEDSSENNSTPMSAMHEDDETDKPYAKLIYEALMQAPGHRMMLREIYDWFIENTSKPQDSGSNGWQNSIRHNLSMNQAFENDKSQPSTRGLPRKANSVWVLTDDAMKNGVQSTTRYRKTGTGKRMAHRMPAPQRQKSGARGGRAARRSAARLRKEDDDKYRMIQQRSPRLEMKPTQSPLVTCYDGSPEQCSMYPYRLLPAVDEDKLMLFYDRPPTGYGVQQSAMPVKMEHDGTVGETTWMMDPPYYAESEHGLEELCKWESD